MLLLVRLKFKSAISVGNGELSQGENFKGILHSDTIFSALINEWVRIFGNNENEIENLISKLNSSTPPFRISSAFPYFLNYYYIPLPYGTEEIYMESLKEVKFLELFDFLSLAAGDHERLKKIRIKNPLDRIMYDFTSPRVTIDRTIASSNVYQSSGWLMHQDAGNYFLIDLKDEGIKDKLAVCIRMLGESGIGGDRSIGFGAFEADISNADDIDGWSELFKEREGGDVFYCSLSLCCPLNDEAKEAVSYRIVPRKGWIFSHSSAKQMKRRGCRMFAEGSIFKKPVRGQVVDVTPSIFRQEHNIYRYGLGMMIEISKIY